MSQLAIKLFGTEEPPAEQRVLTAGPITATFENGQLRWIRIGKSEAIRAIAFLVRDRNWSTANPEISDLSIDQSDGGFRVTFTASCPTMDGTFTWRGQFTGTPDGTVQCIGVGSPDQDFLTGRTGFVILHPLTGFVGKPVTIEHTDGAVERSAISMEIAPSQPFLSVRAISHEPLRGVKAEIRMEGDSWEMEDHRNWTDSSFKTYCRPLSLPYPYEIAEGEQVRHKVTLKFTGTLPKDPVGALGPVTLRLGTPSGRMPAIGLSVLPEDAGAAVRAAALVKVAGVQHLNCRIDMRAKAWARPLGDYAKLANGTGAKIALEIVIPAKHKPADVLARAAKRISAAELKVASVIVTPADDLKSYPPGTPVPEGVPSWSDVAAGARKAFRNVRIGGGMLSNFTELNRKRPPKNLFDFVSHATSALVHAADDRSVMETLEAVGHIIHSTKAIIGGTPYRIGPSHIGNSFNPYGAEVTPNPSGGRVTMARTDPRHRGLFGAAWHLGYLSQVAVGGVEAATVASPVGEFGIAYRKLPNEQPWFDRAKGAKVYPVYHVIRGLAAAAGAKRVESQSSDTERVRAVAWRRGRATCVWFANLRDMPVQVRLPDLPKGEASLMMLDEETFEAAARDALFCDTGAPFNGSEIDLRPFAVARLQIRG
ncbi:MAG: hypothetical protein JNL14_14575 [Devosia sp.]|uniref:hypothetical protein n=1 Tax=Devosia sp. TaxID=1871048 RepID=UPI001A59A5B8|nr:hypothetical protein [Devosia sp.]MBL8598957.1 hypothetical protein [Devosia sp.]